MTHTVQNINGKKRDVTISVAKAVCIFLMVGGHSGWPETLNHIIAFFHMPFFFFVSGYCFKTIYLNNMKDFFKKRFKGLWWPYVKWGLFFLIINNLLCRMHILPESVSLASLQSHLTTAQDIVFKMKSVSMMLGGYWFIVELFKGSIIAFVIIKLLHNSTLKLSISGGGILITAFLFAKYDLHFGFYYVTFLAALFFLTGHIFKSTLGYKMSGRMTTLSGCLLISICLMLPRTSMTECSYEMVIPYYTIAVGGTLVLLNICRYIVAVTPDKCLSFFKYAGNHTLDILTWHFLSFKLVSLLIIGIEGLDISHLADFPFIDKEYQNIPYWPLYLIIGCIVPLAVPFTKGRIKRIFLNNNITTDKIQ